MYLIECRDGSLYTGASVDVLRRFRLHAAGRGARYTRSHPPLRLAAIIPQSDRASALRAEAAIKRLGVAAKRALCLLHAPQLALPPNDGARRRVHEGEIA